MSQESAIDPEAIENLRALDTDGDDAFLREIVGIFLQDTPVRLAELHTSLAAGDVTRFSRAAHSLKGSASNLGATRLSGAAARLEQLSRAEGLGGVSASIPEIEAEFAAAKAELEKLLAPST